MGRDHTLFSLVDGYVQFIRVARRYIPPQHGRKWVKKTFRKFINVTEIPQHKKLVLTQLITPSDEQPTIEQ